MEPILVTDWIESPLEFAIFVHVVDFEGEFDPLLEGPSRHDGEAPNPLASLHKVGRLDVEGAEKTLQSREVIDLEHGVHQTV